MQLPACGHFISGDDLMKKINTFSISNIIGLIIGFLAVLQLLRSSDEAKLSGIDLPAAFPGKTGLAVIWGFIFLLWGIGVCFVYSVSLSPRTKRNIFLNSIILIIGIFVWNFMIFSSCNLSGALAVSAAVMLLAVVVWFMYLVTHRYGGYLFTPAVVWLLFVLYLSIALVVKN